ncbi:hypothetical protein V6R21_20735 [Limibacter armeniacum]|uniref:hypothetical protein n=1 Tax=Limibacter armeniacum TaxID=466084 RepID=UPI002FE56C25
MQFMVEAEMPEVFSDEILDMIPNEITRMNDLMSDNVVSSYTLSGDRKRLWVTLDVENEEKAREVMDGFSLADHMHYEIYELAFLETAPMRMPAFSLN